MDGRHSWAWRGEIHDAFVGRGRAVGCGPALSSRKEARCVSTTRGGITVVDHRPPTSAFGCILGNLHAFHLGIAIEVAGKPLKARRQELI